MNQQLSHLVEIFPKLLAALPAAIGVIAGALAASFLIGRVLKLVADKTSLTFQDIAPFRKVCRWLVFIAAFVLLLEIFGVSLGGLWAVLSTVLAMIGIGFVAVWSVLSNTLCTFVILIFHPFAIGDEIEFAGEPVRGRVIDLNFVYTTVQCDDGSDMQIPNNLFFQKVLKRRHNGGPISLAAQLNARTPARL